MCDNAVEFYRLDNSILPTFPDEQAASVSSA
jgi:hypothetical protein